jgi:hypothetical protein
MGAMG